MSGDLLVLGWHNVEGTWYFPAGPGDGTRGLRRQLAVVARTCNVVPLQAALDELRAGRRLPHRAVALTFDDGYRDALVAADLLERRGLPATFFLVTDALSGRPTAWWEELGHAVWTSPRHRVELAGTGVDLTTRPARRRALTTLASLVRSGPYDQRAARLAAALEELAPPSRWDPAELFLTWDDAAQLVRRGHTVGSHSSTHAALSGETGAAQRRELAGSKALLEERLRIEVRSLAYPYGNPQDVDDRAERAAAEAGYSYAVTSVPGPNGTGSRWLRLQRQLVEPSGARGLLAVRHSFGGWHGILGLAARGDDHRTGR